MAFLSGMISHLEKCPTNFSVCRFQQNIHPSQLTTNYSLSDNRTLSLSRTFSFRQLPCLLDFVGNSLRNFRTGWQLHQEFLPIVDCLLVLTRFRRCAASERERLLILRIDLQAPVER